MLHVRSILGFSLLVFSLAISFPAAAQIDRSCRVVEQPSATIAAATAGSVAWGTRLQYRAFSGFTYMVTSYPGVHVELLLIDRWANGPEALSDEEIRRLITRADLLYETYRDLTGSEPRGEGLLRIAMVPVDRAVGQARRGAKDIEINETTLADFRMELAHDAVDIVFSHEMAHNFDKTSNSYSIGADRAHAWTALVENLALVYEQGVTIHPLEELQQTIDSLSYPQEWLADPQYHFDRCGALDNDCGTPRINAMFAYLGLRTLQLHGIARAPRLLTALTHWQERFGETYMSRAAADVYVEILAETAERDVSCYVDAWKWYASPALRQRLAAKYGPNSYCADGDGDGWTPFAGDTDDSDRAVHPAAPEVRDGRDNDGDGIVDNAYFADGVDAGFGLDLRVSTPFVLDGRIDHPAAGDWFRFNVTNGGTYIMSADRRGPFEGAVRLYNVDGGREVQVEAIAFSRYGTTREQWQLAPGSYRMLVTGAITGAYRIRLHAAKQWPEQWGRVHAPVVANGKAKLVVETNLAPRDKTPTHAELWVDGVGKVATLPWRERLELDWALPADLSRLRYRARLMHGLEPLTGWSLPAEALSTGRRRVARH